MISVSHKCIDAFESEKDSSQQFFPLTNALCNAFLRNVEKLMRNGIIQNYLAKSVVLRGSYKGSINWPQQIQKFPGQFYPLICKYSDYSENIVENQLLKRACHVLLSSSLISDHNAKRIRHIFNRFQNVDLVPFDPKRLPHIVYTPQNQSYEETLTIAFFVLKNFSW